jgi:heat-inducible transcriptional repressor
MSIITGDPLAKSMAVIQNSVVNQLNERSREVFRLIVESYVDTGEPVGSRTLARRLTQTLSPATIRNVMADLQDAGLLYAPHTSAGRMPTAAGMRLFVNGLLEVGHLADDERRAIDAQCAATGQSLPQVLEQASGVLSGLSRCACVVMAPKSETGIKQIEFVSIGPGRMLVVLVAANGLVENRIVEVPLGLSSSTIQQATNYVNARLGGRPLSEVAAEIQRELELNRNELDELTRKLVEAGMATWSGDRKDGYLIVRGQANLLEDVTAIEDLERVRALFEMLDTKEAMAKLLDVSQQAEGVQIYIGAESQLFQLSGCTMIAAPYLDGRERIVGAIGVIGPTRLNYARIIPMVDYTAKLVGRLMG